MLDKLIGSKQCQCNYQMRLQGVGGHLSLARGNLVYLRVVPSHSNRDHRIYSANRDTISDQVTYMIILGQQV